MEKTCAPRRLCYSCMINSGRSLENIVVFGQKAHLRHGLRSDSVGWDGESLNSECMIRCPSTDVIFHFISVINLIDQTDALFFHFISVINLFDQIHIRLETRAYRHLESPSVQCFLPSAQERH